MKLFLKILPWCFVALFGAELVAVLLPKPDGEFHVREFARLPVLLNGRIQPFDSVARNSLLQIRSTGDVPLEQVPAWQFWRHPRKLRATEWLLEVMTRPDQADTRPIFLIHHPDLLGELKLDDKGVEKSGLRYYTFNELKPVLQQIMAQGERASEVKPEVRTPVQKQTVKLSNAVILYRRLKYTLRPEDSPDFARTLADFEQHYAAGLEAARAQRDGKEHDQVAFERLASALNDFDLMARLGYPLVVPPLRPEVSRDEWTSAGASLVESAHGGRIHPAMMALAEIATAYQHGQPERFNRAVAGYKNWLAERFQPELTKGRKEFFYNDTKLFLHAMIIYLFAFVLAAAALLTLALAPNLSEALRRSALYLILLACAAHTFGLLFRMHLEGRPPVTNLYSSAVFIGWGAVVLGLVLERVFRVGLGGAVAALIGFVTLIIAHNLALGGDTMEMLRAVLDTNFWLATHVVIITLGYSSTFVAGLLAIGYIVLGVCTPLLRQKLAVGSAASTPAGPSAAPSGQVDLGKALAKMVYGIVCFATLFSFLGTILGGIWADQSWGRFWGWDPKENGALLIVLWNAVILHARWGGLVRERGLMNLAIVGNIVTSWSWFGTNMLGIGLHSYGFMDAAFRWLMLFIGSQLLFIAVGLLPLKYWASFRAGEAVSPAEASAGPRSPRPKPAASPA